MPRPGNGSANLWLAGILAAGLVALTGAAAPHPAPPDDPPPPARPDEAPDADEPDEQKDKPAEPAPEPPDDPLPDLDDLLGLPSDKKPAPTDEPLPEPAHPTRTDLERKLSGEEIAEEFRQAVQLMNETSGRLQGARDTGLVTQRLQEEIVRKLDMLIKAAQQRQQRGGSSSQQQQLQDPQQQPAQQQASAQTTGQGDNNAERDPPQRREGPLDAQIGGYGAAWGHLPARVRDALLQGSADQYSSVYQKLTEAYYRRLAEEERR